MNLEMMLNKEKTELEKTSLNKKKGWFLVLIIVVILAIIFGLIYYFILSKDWQGRWLVYENSRFGYSIEYPVDWTLGSAPTNNDGRNITSLDEETTCSVFGFANSLLSDSGDPQTLDEHVDWILTNEDVDLISREEVEIDGEEAIFIHYNSMGRVIKAVYTLNQEEGLGFWCSYYGSDSTEKNSEIFESMVSSIKVGLNLSSESVSGSNSCQNLLSGVITPLMDLQTIVDDQYTEVTITDREYWDTSKLPGQVTSFEQDGYYCLPTPIDFENQEPIGIDSEPVVTKVEWKCELEYTDWQYLEEDSSQISALEADGYRCEEEQCAYDNGENSKVILCTR